MTNLISSKAAANELKVSVRTVQLHCRAMAVERVGWEYIITPQVLERLRRKVRTKVGRPKEGAK